MNSTSRISRKNVRIIFQKNSVVTDRYKNHVNMWKDYFSCFAYANTYTAQEEGNEITYENRSITFATRYCPELACVTSTEYRIIFNGEAFNILSVDPMNCQNKELHFVCRREKRQ